MSLSKHHRGEIAVRLYYLFISFFLSCITCFNQKIFFFYLALAPIRNLKGFTQSWDMVYGSLSGAFISCFVLVGLVSLFFATIFFGVQTLFFLINGFFFCEQLASGLGLTFYLLSAWSGVYFSFNAILPNMVTFFEQVNHSTITNPLFSFEFFPEIGDYLSFCFKICFAIILGFQLPLAVLGLLYFSNYFILVITKKRRALHFFFFVVCCSLSPPDFLIQFVLYSTFGALLEFSLLTFCIFNQACKKPDLIT